MSSFNLWNCPLTAAVIKYLSLAVQLGLTVKRLLSYSIRHPTCYHTLHWSTVMQRAILKRTWHALNLYKFASVGNAGAALVMKYSLFSWVLLVNMQARLCMGGSDSAHCVYVTVTMREQEFQLDGLAAYDQKLLISLEAVFHVLPLKCLCFKLETGDFSTAERQRHSFWRLHFSDASTV